MTRERSIRWLIGQIGLACACCLSCASMGASLAAAEIDFNRDIRPILSDNCFRCHGPDAGERQTDLRLDVRESAFAELSSGGHAIVAGEPASSEMIHRIESDDADIMMPPPESGKTLSVEQREMLARWIESGADWQDHWSFVAPRRSSLPTVQVVTWPQNSIDYFTLARMESMGLSPADEADRRTLIRRVTLDLTGLPPTPAEIKQFLTDPEPGSYERLVDRLLESPRYGEHQARIWLDAARYGDTHGLHLDNERSIWPYRDWVIKAFNENMPFDRFTVEQLAGDLLPSPTLSQRVATGFNRCNVTTSEGGSIAQEYLVRYAVDRVETTATVWMGLTAGCAACHDHKFDPLSQKEFYQLFAYFYSQTERAMDGNALIPPPSVKTGTVLQKSKLRRLVRQRDQLRDEQHALRQRSVDALPKWVDEYRRSSTGQAQPAGALLTISFEENDGDQVSAGGDRLGQVEGTTMWDAGKVNTGLRFDGDTHVDFGDVAAFDREDAFSLGGWIYPTEMSASTVLSRMDDAQAFRGYDVYLGGGKVFAHLISHWDDNAIRVNTQRKLSLNSWQHVFVTYDGSGKAGGLRIYIDGQPQELEITHDHLRDSIRTDATFKVGRRSGSAPFQGVLDEVAVYDRVLAEDEVLALIGGDPLASIVAMPMEQWTDDQRQQVLERLLVDRNPEYRRLKEAILRQDAQIRRLEGRFASTLVMQEMSNPRVAHVLKRGEYDQPGEAVEPGVPAVFPAFDPQLPNNRLGLAKWLVEPTHPLTSRVTVNRLWQQHFGIGLVKTAEDFGSQGEWPSHPELLDWLAVEFVKSGWDVKAMHRLMVTSATYRQSADVATDSYREDPDNRLLARGPRHRLDAETIRDQALAVSGLLSEQVGGKSVKPYQPDGLWSAVGYTTSNTANFTQDHGESLYRRSLYTFWKRTSPPPSMQILDAPSREVCVVRRPRTNSPGAALVLMNDPQFVEAARHLAEHLLQQRRTDAARIDYGFERVIARKPTNDERAIVMNMLSAFRTRYQEDPESASQLVGVGESVSQSAGNVGELAAWTLVANTLLNLDETISKP